MKDRRNRRWMGISSRGSIGNRDIALGRALNLRRGRASQFSFLL
jgi:hypothetical protein